MNITRAPAEPARRPRRRWAAVAAAISFAGIAGFEIALAAGAPLGRAGYHISPIPPRACRYGTWALAGLLTVGTLMNLASSSAWERYLQSPTAGVTALLCLLVARSAPAPPRTHWAMAGA